MNGRLGSPLLALLLGLPLLGLACASSGGRAPLPSEPSLGRSLHARQHLLARHAQGEHSMEVVIEADCEEVRLVGLTPFGTPLFSAVQDAEGIAVESIMGLDLPFPPERVMRDIRLVLFHSTPMEEGVVEIQHGSLRVRERWKEGRLRQRQLLDPADAVAATVNYRSTETPQPFAQHVELAEHHLGYHLSIRSFDVVEGECP